MLDAVPNSPPPPYVDLPLERAVLAEVLLDDRLPNVTYARLAALGVTGASFYDPRHATLWNAYTAIVAREEPVDVLTVVAELRAVRLLNTVGGAQYVGELTDEIPTLAHCEAHGAALVDLARVREAGGVVDAMRVTLSHGGHPSEVLAKVRAHALRLPASADASRGTSIANHLCEGLDEIVRLADARAKGVRITARFGVTALDGSDRGDGALVPLVRQNIVTLVGAPGAGKTTLAWAAALVTARDALAAADGRLADAERVLVFTTEMRGPQVSLRLASLLAGVAYGKLRTGRATQEDLDAVFARCNELGNLPIDIYDSRVNRGVLTADDVLAHSLAAVSTHRVALVVADYFQDFGRCHGNEDLRRTSDTADEVQRAKILHRACVDADVPMIVVSSMNKEGQKGHAEGKAATTNARGAGLDFATDIMAHLVPANPEEMTGHAGVADLYLDVTKNRYGKTGKRLLKFDKARGMFRDAGRKEGAMPEAAPDDPAQETMHPDTGGYDGPDPYTPER